MASSYYIFEKPANAIETLVSKNPFWKKSYCIRQQERYSGTFIQVSFTNHIVRLIFTLKEYQQVHWQHFNSIAVEPKRTNDDGWSLQSLHVWRACLVETFITREQRESQQVIEMGYSFRLLVFLAIVLVIPVLLLGKISIHGSIVLLFFACFRLLFTVNCLTNLHRGLT